MQHLFLGALAVPTSDVGTHLGSPGAPTSDVGTHLGTPGIPTSDVGTHLGSLGMIPISKKGGKGKGSCIQVNGGRGKWAVGGHTSILQVCVRKYWKYEF